MDIVIGVELEYTYGLEMAGLDPELRLCLRRGQVGQG